MYPLDITINKGPTLELKFMIIFIQLSAGLYLSNKNNDIGLKGEIVVICIFL